jgi:hypothetical protein
LSYASKTNVSRLDARMDFLRALQRNLKLLLADIDVGSTHDYLFVIDFAAIYAYIYRTKVPGIFPTIPGESSEQSYARGQLALEVVFSGKIRPLLLIPPYATELTNHLNLLAMQVDLSISSVGLEFRARLRRMIASSKEFADFVKLRSSIKSNEEHALRRAVLEIGRKYFPELYSVVSARTSSGLERLRRLFRENILEDADTVIPECQAIACADDLAGVDKWVKKIRSRRQGVRTFPTLIDAMACEYIVSANTKLNEHGKVVVFVSPSRILQATLEEEAPCITIEGRTSFGTVRDLTYFLLSLTHKGDRRNIRFSLDTVNELLQIYSGISEPRLERAWPLIEQAEEKWKHAENLLFMTESIIPTHVVESKATHDDEFLSILKSLHEAVQTNRPELEAEIREFLNGFRAAILELDKAIPRGTPIDLPGAVLPPHQTGDEEEEGT